LKPRSSSKKSKQPHDPFQFVLDEGLSGDRLHKLLLSGRFIAFQYEHLGLKKNDRTPDEMVLEACSRGHVLISKDKRMHRDEIESIIRHNGKLIVLTDSEGGVMEFASALVAAKSKIERALLNSLHDPIVIRLNHDASINNIRGADELRQRYQQFVTGRIRRVKKIEVKHAKLGPPARTVGLGE
jgi:hypothetical protein